MVRTFKEHIPHLTDCSFIADNASIIGNVRMGKGSSVWYGAVLRADTNSITVGENTKVIDAEGNVISDGVYTYDPKMSASAKAEGFVDFLEAAAAAFKK